MTTPLAPIRREKVAEMGSFEVWRTPRGDYDLTHKSERVATVPTLHRARELVRFCHAHAVREASA